jgi:hypothetical protein
VSEDLIQGTELNEELALVSQADIDAALLAPFESMPMPSIDWLYDRAGRSTWYYETKISLNTFSESEYRSLIKYVYSFPLDSDSSSKSAAVYALQYSAYKALATDSANDIVLSFKDVLLSQPFLKKAVSDSLSLIQYVPRYLPHYMDVIVESIEFNPLSFDYIDLRYKISPEPISALFKSNDIFIYGDRHFKKRALEYSSIDIGKTLMSSDGHYLELAPMRLKMDPAVVMSAVKQRPSSIKYAEESLQNIIQEKGLSALSEITTAPSIIPEETLTRENGDIMTSYIFESTREVVVDHELIDLVENSIQRRLLELWKIAEGGNFGDVYIAKFQPDGVNYLGALLLITNDNRVVTKTFPALYDPKKPNSVWFDGDSGQFLPENFRLLALTRSNDRASIEYTWEKNSMSKPFRLIQNETTFESSELLF